jgi:hypothetical protein
MAFKEGHEKAGGRKKGAENKITADARKVFIDTLEGLAPNVQKAFLDVLNGTEGKEPNPERFLDLFAKYAQYFVPKKTESDINLLGDLTQTIINLGNGQNPDETTT